jgi:hypothetical protein
VDDIILFLKDRKNLINLLTLVILVLGLPIGVNLVRQQQVIQSRAANNPVSLVEDGNVVVSRKNNLVIVKQPTKTTVGIQLTAPTFASVINQSTVAEQIIPVAYAACGVNPDDGVCYCDNQPSDFNRCQVGHQCSGPDYSCGPVDGHGNSSQMVVKRCYYDGNGSCNDCRYDGSASSQCGLNEPGPSAPTSSNPSTNPSTNPSNPPSGTLNIAVSPSNPKVGDQVTVDLTGNSTCSTNVSFTLGDGLVNCAGAQLVSNTGGNFDWRKTCTAAGGSKAGTRYTALGAGGSCQANTTYTVTTAVEVLKQYKIAISSNPNSCTAALAAATAVDFPTDGLSSLEFTDAAGNNTPGQKYICTDFIGDQGTHKAGTPLRVTMVPPDPQVTAVSCNYDITQSTVAIAITGTNFGTEQPTLKMTVPSQADVQVDTNDDTSITGTLNSVPSNVNQDLRFSVARGVDGATITGTCHFGLSQIVVHSSQACLTSGGLNNGAGLEDVELMVVDNAAGSQPTTQAISIDAKGVISGLTTTFQKDHTYKLAIKAPRSLRRVQKFTAGGKSTSINFSKSLPLGDIAPSNGDDAINSFDYQELKAEWGQSSTKRLGDLNGDGVVNSLDWSCMKQFFGQSSDPIPSPDGPKAASSSASAAGE